MTTQAEETTPTASDAFHHNESGDKKEENSGAILGTKNGRTIGVDIDNVTLKDIEYDHEGNPISVFGVSWDKLPVKQVRTICSKLGVKGVKNVKKSTMIDVLKKWCYSRKVYDNMRANLGLETNDTEEHENQGGGAPRKEIQCSFRLMNILFCDAFANEFALLGNIASRDMLDAGKAANDQYFWEQVQATFVTDKASNEDYGRLLFVEDDEVFAEQEHFIDPSVIVGHDWKRLRKIWKAVNAEYKAALTRFTVSGTHDDNFFGFCNGKLETYYLRLHLIRRPQLNGMVEAALPDKCFMSSEMPITELQRKLLLGKKGNSSSSGGDPHERNTNKKQKTTGNNVVVVDNSDVIEALREFGSSQRKAEFITQRLNYLAKEDSRRNQQVMMGQWEKLKRNIRLLRQEILEDGLTDATRNELEMELVGVTRKKNELAKELGFM